MGTFIFFLVMIFGISRIVKSASSNPGKTIQAASWLKQMFK